MQLDPAPRLSKPFLHELGMMIGCVVEKDICGRILTPPDCNGFDKLWLGHNC